MGEGRNGSDGTDSWLKNIRGPVYTQSGRENSGGL